MKTMKKVTSLCLVLCMILSVMSLSAFADEPAFAGRTADYSDSVVFFDNVRENPNHSWGDKIIYHNGTKDVALFSEVGLGNYSPTDSKYGMKLAGSAFDPCAGLWGFNVQTWSFYGTPDMYFSIHYQVKNATNTGVQTAESFCNNGNGGTAHGDVHIKLSMDIQNDVWKTHTIKLGDNYVDASGNATTADVWPVGYDYFGIALPALEGEGAYYVIDYVGLFATAEDAASEAAFWEAFHNGTPMVGSAKASVAAGTYYAEQDVVLTSATAGAKIYYTTDGTEPTNASTLYSEPIKVTEPITLKTVAYDETAQKYSAVKTYAYEIKFPSRTSDISDEVIFFDNVRLNPANSDGCSGIIYNNGKIDTARLYTFCGLERYSPTDSKYGLKLFGADWDGFSGNWGLNIRDWSIDVPTEKYFSIHYQVKSATNTGMQTAGALCNNGNGDTVHLEIKMDIQNDVWKTYTVKLADNLVDNDKNPTTAEIWPAANKDYWGLTLPSLEGEGAHYVIDYIGIFDTAEDAANEAAFWEAFYAGEPKPYSVEASVAAGTYYEPKEVELTTATAGAKIYYTTDGTEPTNASALYASALRFEESTTLKAVAYDETNQRYSTVTTFVYAIDSNVVMSPEFSSEIDFVPAGKEIALSTKTEGAEIYYTVDGTEPTAQSTKYTAPIVVNAAMTIKAIAVKTGMDNSPVVSLEIKGIIADSILWTYPGLIGGSANGDLSEAQGVYHNTEFGAIFGGGEWGLKNDELGGLVMQVHKDKEIALRMENWSFADNIIRLPNGSYRYLALTYKTPVSLELEYHALHYQNGERSQKLTLAAAENYTTVVIDLLALNPNWAKQGGQPDFTLQFYHGSDEPTTLSILSVGFYQTQAEAEKTVVANPNASMPASDKYYQPISVELVSATDGAKIYYTTDGSVPSATNGTLYTGAINISEDTVIKAIAIKENCKDSLVMTFDYKVTPTVAQPTIDLKGGQYEGAQTVTITCATEGAKIYYTLDGSTPSATNGTLYTGPITLKNSCVLKAVGVLEGQEDSKPTSRTYNITGVVEETTAPEGTTSPEETTTAAPADDEKGCASSMAVGALVLMTVLSGACVVVCKKKEN